MRKLLLLILSVMLLSSCSAKYVNFTSKPSDEITTPKLKAFLKEKGEAKVVLRVPNFDDNTMSSNLNDGYYTTIEKEFMRKGYIVRDRALFNEVIEKAGGEIDYEKLAIQTDTDLIIELVKFDTEVVYRTNMYKTDKGKSGTLKNEYRYYGVDIEFKIVLIAKNEFAGSYIYYYAPCQDGCMVTKGTDKFFTLKKKKDIPYKVVEKSEIDAFIKNVTLDLISSLQQ